MGIYEFFPIFKLFLQIHEFFKGSGIGLQIPEFFPFSRVRGNPAFNVIRLFGFTFVFLYLSGYERGIVNNQ